MPALSYTSSDFPFQPFTKIYSADVNQCFNDIKTLLNTTKLDDTNLQDAGITRATKLKVGTPSYIVTNAAVTGAMSESQFLTLAQGGLGASFTIGTPNQVLMVDPTGTSLQFGAVSSTGSTIYGFYRFG